jgi:hypothetical protein
LRYLQSWPGFIGSEKLICSENTAKREFNSAIPRGT